MTTASTNEVYYCGTCNKRVKSHYRFCPNCGEYLGADSTRINLFNNSSLQAAFFFFIVYLVICLAVQFTGLFNSYNRLFGIETLLSAFTLLYVVKNFNAIKPLLKFRNFTLPRLISFIVIALVASVVVNIIVVKLNFSFFRTDTNYYTRYSIYSMPAAIMIYSIALNPAVTEELAFRGVLYNYLSNFLNERLVVIVTAFAFAMLHLSFISLTWLLPFGIFVGFMRMRYKTIWYGVIFHFVFNLVAVLFDLYRHGHLS